MTVYDTKKQLIETLVDSTDSILDVGFWGQGVRADDPLWPHRLMVQNAHIVDGLDILIDLQKAEAINPKGEYFEESAEVFDIKRTYEKIFALDLIEHLPNPGLFLDACKRHLVGDGKLVLTTPNTFGLFLLAGKLMHQEPPVNNDHTCYFNRPTIQKLLEKCGWQVEEFSYIYTLGKLHNESLKKKSLNMLYKLLSFFTPKYLETIVVVATPIPSGTKKTHG